MTNNRDKHLSEARFHKLFDDTQVMSIQGYRADGTVVYWNAASEAIYGYSTLEALGQTLYDLIIPDDIRAEVKQSVAWMFENQQGIPPARINMKHKDGSTVSRGCRGRSRVARYPYPASTRGPSHARRRYPSNNRLHWHYVIPLPQQRGRRWDVSISRAFCLVSHVPTIRPTYPSEVSTRRS